MKLKHFIKFISILTLVFTVSCEFETIEPIDIDITDPISFSTELQPIFDAKCITCHSSTKPVLTSAVSYNNLINGDYININDPEDSELYEKVADGHPGGNNSLTAEEMAKLLKWIEDGAEDN